MARAKPCLGHQSRLQAVSALSGEGFTTAEIADRINAETPEDPITVAQVSRLRWVGAGSRARKAPAMFCLGPGTYELLAREASARGCAAGDLARRLIETVLTENLINAVLDDGGEA